MFLNKIRNIFCVPDRNFVSATNAVAVVFFLSSPNLCSKTARGVVLEKQSVWNPKFSRSQGFQIQPAPGASHRLLQAFAPGTFRIPNFINYTILFHQSNHDLFFSRK